MRNLLRLTFVIVLALLELGCYFRRTDPARGAPVSPPPPDPRSARGELPGTSSTPL